MRTLGDLELHQTESDKVCSICKHICLLAASFALFNFIRSSTMLPTVWFTGDVFGGVAFFAFLEWLRRGAGAGGGGTDRHGVRARGLHGGGGS